MTMRTLLFGLLTAGASAQDVAFSFDLRAFHRVSRAGPLMTTPQGSGALRYFDVLPFADATYVYYEMALPDGSHDMRVFRR